MQLISAQSDFSQLKRWQWVFKCDWEQSDKCWKQTNSPDQKIGITASIFLSEKSQISQNCSLIISSCQGHQFHFWLFSPSFHLLNSHFFLHFSYFLGFYTLISLLCWPSGYMTHLITPYSAFQAAKHPYLYQPSALAFEDRFPNIPQIPHPILVSQVQSSVNPRTNCSITPNPVKVDLSFEL